MLNSDSNPNGKVGYLPSISAPPTDMNIIFTIIRRAIEIMNKLEIEDIYLEIDQAICKKSSWCNV